MLCMILLFWRVDLYAGTGHSPSPHTLFKRSSFDEGDWRIYFLAFLGDAFFLGEAFFLAAACVLEREKNIMCQFREIGNARIQTTATVVVQILTFFTFGVFLGPAFLAFGLGDAGRGEPEAGAPSPVVSSLIGDNAAFLGDALFFPPAFFAPVFLAPAFFGDFFGLRGFLGPAARFFGLFLGAAAPPAGAALGFAAFLGDELLARAGLFDFVLPI